MTDNTTDDLVERRPPITTSGQTPYEWIPNTPWPNDKGGPQGNLRDWLTRDNRTPAFRGRQAVMDFMAEQSAEIRRLRGALPDQRVMREALRDAQEALVFIKNWMRTECMNCCDYPLALSDAEGALAKVTAALQPKEPVK